MQLCYYLGGQLAPLLGDIYMPRRPRRIRSAGFLDVGHGHQFNQRSNA